MTSAGCPQPATLVEPTRGPGISRGRVWEVAASAHDVPPARPSIRGPPHAPDPVVRDPPRVSVTERPKLERRPSTHHTNGHELQH
jgi:hypothetical protein